jgi:hypothetical protein
MKEEKTPKEKVERAKMESERAKTELIRPRDHERALEATLEGVVEHKRKRMVKNERSA